LLLIKLKNYLTPSTEQQNSCGITATGYAAMTQHKFQWNA